MTAPEIPPAEPAPASKRWLQGLLAAARTFSYVMGATALGLIGGLCYGARVASQTSSPDEFFTFMGWAIGLVIYGAIGLVGGLAAGLLVIVIIWILRLAKRIAGGIEQGALKPPAASDREEEI
jgi:hypothetical protein